MSELQPLVKIEVDYNPSPTDVFYISAYIRPEEAICFACTTDQKIIKQVLREKKKFPKDRNPLAEWDVIIVKERKYGGMYHVRYITLGNKVWCNDEIWENVWTKPLPNNLKDTLLYYSRLVSDNYRNLGNMSKEMENFENILLNEVERINR